MTKKQAEQIFKSEILPQVIKRYESDGIQDKPARRMAWNDYVDSLNKNGDITDNQRNWTHPKWLVK